MEKISIFEIFKIGVGPSSSHTIGPWRAAIEFISSYLLDKGDLRKVKRVEVRLLGSLSKTGVGHGTDLAVIMGLCGRNMRLCDTTNIVSDFEKICLGNTLNLFEEHIVEFNYKTDVIFDNETEPEEHPNTVVFSLWDEDGNEFSQTYCSTGGGFINLQGESSSSKSEKNDIPFPTNSAKDMIRWTDEEDRTIADISIINELHWQSLSGIRDEIHALWKTILESVYQGCHTSGTLPGGLNVKRRAFDIHKKLIGDAQYSTIEEWQQVLREQKRDHTTISRWVSCFALAVNEVNASFGRIVTAPTNGAAGVVPAALMYLMHFHDNITRKDMEKFFLVAGEIGILFKKNATISAAAGGCQAEIGVSSSMAAAGLTSCLGGSTRQILQAAETAMEHHLGLTCDPVGGLVQIPCIERNAFGASQAITSANLALISDPDEAKVSLDDVIQAMWETAQDMNFKYKETAEGGLALQIPLSEAQC